MKDEIKDLLLRSLDSALTAEEAAILDEALKSDASLHQEAAEWKALRGMLKGYEVQEEAEFTDVIMTGIREQSTPAVTAVLKKMYPYVAAACLAVICILAGYALIDQGGVDTDTLMGLQQLSADEATTFINAY